MNLILESLNNIFQRDLDNTIREINTYNLEADLWKVEDGINNSAGNLSLHLCGNLSYFVGVVLGNSGYQRNRDAEFSDKNIPREELIQKLEETKKSISSTLAKLSIDDLEKLFPVQVWKDRNYSTLQFLIHLATHLNYHLGQINYHRRLLTK